MNKVLTLIFFTLFISTGFSQTDSTKIAFVAYWWVGDSYDFKVTKKEQNWRDDKLIKNDSSQYIANFKVLDSTETSYKIQWTYKNTLVSNIQNKIAKIFNDTKKVNQIISKYNITKVIYTTNEYGEFVDIENWKEISDFTKEFMNELERSFETKYPEKQKMLKELLTPLTKFYSSKEGVVQNAIYELLYFHFPFGTEYDTKEALECEQELPNVLGGDPIKGTATLTIDEIDFSDDYCVLKEEVSINEEDAKRVTTKMMKKMGLVDKEAEKLLKSATFDIKDLNYYQYYYYPGVPHRIYGCRRTFVEVDKTKTENISELIIEMIYKD